MVPDVVWQEVQQHRPTTLRHRSVPLQRVESITPSSPKLLQLLDAIPVDPGEEQALRLMQMHVGATLLTDDNAAREVALQMDYLVHGTLGVLLLGYQRGRRTKRQLLNLLQTLSQRSTLHAAKRLLNGLILQVRAEE